MCVSVCLVCVRWICMRNRYRMASEQPNIQCVRLEWLPESLGSIVQHDLDLCSDSRMSSYLDTVDTHDSVQHCSDNVVCG